MPRIANDLSSLSKPTASANAPSTTPLLMRSVAERWFTDHMAQRQPRTRAIEELPLRASEFSVRCDRQYFYVLTDAEVTEPDGPASIWRFHLGQVVHDVIDEAIAALPKPGPNDGWRTEVDVDLRPAGIPGSAHADAVHYTNGEPDIVAEFKSVPGFGFKLMATRFKGQPEGPKFEHCLQAATSAVALSAPKFIVGYVALESVSPSLAAGVGADDYGRFTAEWEFDTEEWRPIIEREAKRQHRLLAAAQRDARPARTIDHPDIPAGAYIDNPNRGAWMALDADGNVRQTGTTWMCDYCRFRTRCIDDGANATVEADPTF